MAIRVPPRVLAAIGLVAGCTLALQVLLTRLFSAVLFYHFSFLAISLGLLGTGGGAMLIYLRPAWFERRPLRSVLARGAAAFAALLAIVPLALVHLDYSLADKPAVTTAFAATLAAASALSALPFLAAGVVIALAVRGYTGDIGRLYGADLLGAGAGALLVVPVMWLSSPVLLTVALGGVAAVAALLLTEPRAGRAEGAPALASLVVVAVGLVLAGATSVYHVPLASGTTHDLTPVAERWTPLGRVTGFRPPRNVPFGSVFYDRVYAPVPVHRRGDPLPDWRRLHLGPQSVGYAVSGPGRALIIGGGGGRDIENALTSGQRRVDVIELNRRIRSVVDDDLARYSGSPYSLPRVHTVAGDGRSTLAARDTDYDQIHIGFTDTLSANSAQAFALTEQNLYTVEAFDEYFDHLTARGILNVSRLRRLVGDEALRVTILMLETLRRRGIDHPERNVVVLLGRDIFGELSGTVLGRLRPYTASELARIRLLARARGKGVAFAPGGPYRLEWRALARASSPMAFCRSYRFDVCPPTDNRPFFFSMTRLGDVQRVAPPGYVYTTDPFLVLLVTLAILLVLAAVAFVLPLFAVPASSRPPATSLAFFAAIGVGFLVLEVVLVQRFVLFLGFPTYALSVVLCSLLVSTGAGSLASTRAGSSRSLVAALAAACVLVLLAAFGLQPLLRALIGLPFAARVVAAIVLLAPFGLTLGMAMPIGLRRLASRHPAGVPWAWGVNGIASVVASVLAIAIAILWGFVATTLVALASYLVALAIAARWARAERTPAAERAEPVYEQAS